MEKQNIRESIDLPEVVFLFICQVWDIIIFGQKLFFCCLNGAICSLRKWIEIYWNISNDFETTKNKTGLRYLLKAQGTRMQLAPELIQQCLCAVILPTIFYTCGVH